MPMVDDIAGLRRILRDCRTIAVVGLSANWYRPSYFAAKYMQDKGYRIIPVNPNYRDVLGEVIVGERRLVAHGLVLNGRWWSDCVANLTNDN